MTTEDIKNLFTKAYAYAETKFGKKPNDIIINEDGIITAKWSTYEGCGEYSSEYESFKSEDII